MFQSIENTEAARDYQANVERRPSHTELSYADVERHLDYIENIKRLSAARSCGDSLTVRPSTWVEDVDDGQRIPAGIYIVESRLSAVWHIVCPTTGHSHAIDRVAAVSLLD